MFLPPLPLFLSLYPCLSLSVSFFFRTLLSAQDFRDIYVLMSLSRPKVLSEYFLLKKKLLHKNILVILNKLKYFLFCSICVTTNFSRKSQDHYFILLSKWWMYEGYDINKEIEAKKVMWLSHGWGGGRVTQTQIKPAVYFFYSHLFPWHVWSLKIRRSLYTHLIYPFKSNQLSILLINCHQ